MAGPQPSASDLLRQHQQAEAEARLAGRRWVRSQDLRSLFARQAGQAATPAAPPPLADEEGPAGSPPEAPPLAPLADEDGPAGSHPEQTVLADEKDQPVAAVVFAVPDKPVRRPTEELLKLLNRATASTGPLGKQGLWRPGPGRRPGQPKRRKKTRKQSEQDKTRLTFLLAEAQQQPTPGQPTPGQLLDDTARPPAGTDHQAELKNLISPAFLKTQGTKLRTDFSPEQKVALCKAISLDFQQSGSSRNQVFDRWSKQIGATPETVRRWYDHRAVWEQSAQKRARQAPAAGCLTEGRVGRKPKLQGGYRAAKGARQVRTPGARLGRPDPLLPEREALRQWARQEEQQGHGMSRWDLLRQFTFFVAARKAFLLAKQAEEGLDETEEATLQFATDRLHNIETKKKTRDKTAVALLRQTGFRERQTNRARQLSDEEEARNLRSAWQFCDYLQWLTAKGSAEELGNFVAQPEQFVQRRTETAVTLTDQIPVWLKVEAGSSLVSEALLSAQRQGQKRRKANRKAAAKSKGRGKGRGGAATLGEEDEPGSGSAPEEETDEARGSSYLIKGPGSTDASRWRCSLLARQAVTGFFDPRQPAPTGDRK